MAITSAQYVKNTRTNQNEAIKLVRDSKTWIVPIDNLNKDYIEIQEWVSAGNTIEESD